MTWCKVLMKGRREDARVVFSRSIQGGAEKASHLSGETYSVREDVALAMAAAGVVAALVESSEAFRPLFEAEAAPVGGEPPPVDPATLD